MSDIEQVIERSQNGLITVSVEEFRALLASHARYKAALDSAAATLERTQQRLIKIKSVEIDGISIPTAHSDVYTGAKEARAALTAGEAELTRSAAE